MGFWIKTSNADGISVLMVEHDMGLVSAVSDRVMALATVRNLQQAPLKKFGRIRRSSKPTLARVSFQNRDIASMSTQTTAPVVVLQIDNLESYYGPIMAIRGVSLKIYKGQIVAVLGANGAGKTTLLEQSLGYGPGEGPGFDGGDS